MAGFEDAVQELAQAPLPDFIAERKRLAGALKADGDAAAAKRLLARRRPTISVWVVNQLWWHARDAFDALLSTAEKLRKGDIKASAAHREAITKLRTRARAILTDAGNAPTEATLRRVTTTLSALAVAGGFDPDPPGALTDDRDPPGFSAFGIASDPLDEALAASVAAGDGHGKPAEPKPAKPAKHAKKANADGKHTDRENKATAREQARLEREAARAREAEVAARRAAEMAEKRREEAERKRIAVERHRIESALRDAKAELHDRERDLKQLEKQVATAQKQIERAQEIVDDLARKLDELDPTN